MPPDHNPQHPRRPHYHRGRRGPDRRPGDRRPQQSQPQAEATGRDQIDVEQIMREIRSRISDQHGIDLTSQQIQELAARRLEAILDPRVIKPSLMDELRRASGLPADAATKEAAAEDVLDASALYATDNGFVRVMRRLLNPVLRLFFNPAAVVDALNSQSRRAAAAAAREAELRRRQTEWNALHFEILRRLVTDLVRAEIDNQHLAQRVESLGAKVDFNERRVRGFEQAQAQTQPQTPHQPRPAPRPIIDTPVASSAPAPPREEHPSTEHGAPEATSPDGSRRRRRRRRGRRSGQPRDVMSGAPLPGTAGAAPLDQGSEGDDFGDDDESADDQGDDTRVVATIAEEQRAVAFEPPPQPAFDAPAPVPQEPLQEAPVELDRAPTVATSAPTPDPIASDSPPPDRVTPDQS